MKMKQMFPELRKDIGRDDLIRALVIEADLMREFLMRPVDTSFVELKDNIHFFYDIAGAVKERMSGLNSNILTRFGQATNMYQQIPDDREFIALVQVLGPLANKPWRIIKTSEEWRNLPSGITSRIISARNAYARCHRHILAVMGQALMAATGRVFEVGQVVSYISAAHGFPSVRYPVGGLLNPLLNEHDFHYLENSPNLPIYKATVELLRDYGPGARHWKQLSLRQFTRFYVGIRNTVFRNLHRDHVIQEVEAGIARGVFTTECAEIAVARKLQDLRSLQDLLPSISNNPVLRTALDLEASKMSFDIMHEIMHEQGKHFGPLKDLIAMVNDSASAEVTLRRGAE